MIKSNRIASMVLAGMLAPVSLFAKIDLVTLPGRDSTQISIYKDADLTLVREIRTLTFDEGSNEIQFSWANTLIDPTSLKIHVVRQDTGLTILDAHYPAGTLNTIVWTIEAKREGPAQVEITCFASGVSWRADYKAIADAGETTLRVEPNFTIFNNSGEDFKNAKTRLVVGEVNLVELIADLANRGLILINGPDEEVLLGKKLLMADMDANGAIDGLVVGQSDVKQIIKAAVSEYYLYSISGTEDIETGWGKQLPDPAIEGVPIELSYEYDPNKYGSDVIKFYKFKNDAAHEMGQQPLPAGAFYVFSDDSRGGQRFQGWWNNKYVPVGEDVELNLGTDGQVLVEERTMSESRRDFDFDSNGNVTGWEVVTEREVEIRNSQTREIPMKMRQYFEGDWSVEKPSDEFKKVDESTLEWNLRVPALSKKVLRFTQVVRNGTRAH